LDSTVGVRVRPVDAVDGEVLRAVALGVLAKAALEGALRRAHRRLAGRRGVDSLYRWITVVLVDAALVVGAGDLGQIHAERLHLAVVHRALVRLAALRAHGKRVAGDEGHARGAGAGQRRGQHRDLRGLLGDVNPGRSWSQTPNDSCRPESKPSGYHERGGN